MTRRVTNRALLALGVGGFVLLAAVAALVVDRGVLADRDGEATTVLVSGRTDVPRGQVHENVYVLRGTAEVGGTVQGDVLVVDGRVRVADRGVVHGDVVVLRGDAVIEAGAQVTGDIRTSEAATVDGDAVVLGAVGVAGPLDLLDVAAIVRFGLWAAAGLCVLLLAALAPRRLDEAAANGLRRPGRSVALGALVLAAAPAVVAVLALSLVGALVAAVLAAVLVVAAAAGTTTAAGSLGRLLRPAGGRNSMIVGTAVLGVATAVVLALSPLLAVVLVAVVVAYGLGALFPPMAAATPEAREGRDDPEGHAEAPAEPTPPADPSPVVDASEPRILAAFPLSSGADRN